VSANDRAIFGLIALRRDAGIACFGKVLCLDAPAVCALCRRNIATIAAMNGHSWAGAMLSKFSGFSPPISVGRPTRSESKATDHVALSEI
jgi:hypothetical protein